MCAITSGKIRKWNETEGMLLQILTPPAELRTSPPSRDQLENPVLVSGAQGLGLASQFKTRQGTQFGPGATPRAG